ncbi:MAG: hypothetical protein LAP85_21320 [Acidobacteriia bacterium]|nr:hypothetical protein [Terriglobia bacterium]
MTRDQRLLCIRIALIIYCPLSCLLVGLLSLYIGRIGPSYVAVLFQGGLLRNSIPFPGYPGFIQLPGLVLGFCSFVLATFFSSSSLRFASLFQIRVLLIILIWLLIIPVKAVVIWESQGAGIEAWMRLIFVAVHLIIAFFATYLPFLKNKLAEKCSNHNASLARYLSNPK